MINAESVVPQLENFIYREVVNTHGKMVAIASVETVFECLWLNFRRQYLYIPSTYLNDYGFQGRNKAIWQDFTGNNQAELSIKYRLSLQRIYAIIKKYRADLAKGDKPKRKPIALAVIEEYLPPELTKCGLSDDEAKTIADKVAVFLCQNFPGISIKITDDMKAYRQAAAMQAAS